MLCLQSLAQFHGGIGNGYHKMSSNETQYKGGSGKGDNMQSTGTVIFQGNKGQGYSKSEYGTNTFSKGGSGGGSSCNCEGMQLKISALPIHLFYFDAFCDGENIKLVWTTASEINNDYFTIEKSYDAITFEALNHISGAGNSNSFISYEYNDSEVNEDVCYYRLKQTDYDGKYSYSQVISLSCEKTNALDFILYPNPSNGEIFLRLTGSPEQEIIIIIADLHGKKYCQQTLPFISGDIKIEEARNFPKGMYIVNVIINKEAKYKKMIIE
ncbi:MAG: hypothetical protein A2275_02990 [Bacteroidetes bacterium RIFOXYA12_FULL_35_11]|nr:MAG: hypothetical protein A2X01_01945 [Bacteroidetes bacterium GWF2_35_48]OFY75744.1 MAG: hypothetical protein A2275_02990 [Bacteroidetes bacterium RIFOXYA12_FULL_35_11]OFY97588.1 MAG: hypothetical protein A2309_07860 [Bacteroidetes bacterium RIFOXYB2_FULL_35_7]OFZ00371.1 MAG: hypothetical protein A2491_12385 [Bacteroidetes bacterium RIFOXYC12_FULL_35_7]